MYIDEARNTNLHIIGITGESVTYKWWIGDLSGITEVVSLKSCDLFFALLVTHIKLLQNCRFWRGHNRKVSELKVRSCKLKNCK